MNNLIEHNIYDVYHIDGRDGKTRYYRIFRWAATPATQLELLTAPFQGKQYTED